LDWRRLSPTDRELSLAELVESEVRQPFDLTRGPLLRTTLVQLHPEGTRDEHVLFLTIHHMISDGLSMQVLSRELSALYTAYVSGTDPALPPLPVQYADYAHWQRSWLQGEVLEQRLSYWRSQLADAPKMLELPTDRPRPPIQTFTGASEKHSISPSRTAALIALSQAEGVTLYMTLLAGFAIVLARLSGQRDLLIGSPIANRSRPEIEGLIGFFIDTVVLRIDLGAAPTFNELLRRVRTTSLDAYAHQDLPFEQLIDQLQIQRDLSHNPLFQVMLNMLNFEQTRGETPGLTWEPLTLPDPGSKFDLTLYAHNHEDSLELELVYNLDLFDPERMREMLRQLDLVLEQIVASPNLHIDELSLLTTHSAAHLPDPQRQLTVDWTGAAHSAVIEQARRTPEQVALIDRYGAWQYGELAARSNRLAHYLRDGGIQRGDVVAIYADRSAALAAAVIGVLQAGAAFTILDPAYPAPRLIELTRLAAPRGWVQLATAGPLPEELEAAVAAQPGLCRVTVSADGSSAELASYPDTDPGVAVGPDDLAYVAFTSGSTGQPKGILGTHRPLAHFLGWHAQTFSLHAADRFSMLSGLAHDPLLRDLFTPLGLGAALCIPDPDDMLEPGRLARWMREQGVTVTHLTPALGYVLAAGAETAHADQPLLPALRYAFFGGDTLTGNDLLHMRRLAPAATCVNFYGATETPQAMGYAILPPEHFVQPHEQIPLGRGIDDVQLLVLTATRQLAGVGEIGEIYVRTGYLARGYLGDDALSAEKFIADPLASAAADTRLYRTGDLGRYRADGSVEFAGRIDDQIKIRGFRVELGEIERTLQSHPAVAEALVLARETEPGERSLVAYVVPEQNLEPRTKNLEDSPEPGSSFAQRAPVLGSALREFLAQRLPAYMLPSAFVLLDALPLTPNGKVDRRALPEPDTACSDTGAEFVAPRSFVEEELADIWRALLHTQRIGIHNNFFVLGGHSLLLIQLATRIRETC
ncbi:MAG TPA: amino acid adenylation domain-containing protein, partial [Herpetosiphonaceae bacterium]